MRFESASGRGIRRSAIRFRWRSPLSGEWLGSMRLVSDGCAASRDSKLFVRSKGFQQLDLDADLITVLV